MRIIAKLDSKGQDFITSLAHVECFKGEIAVRVVVKYASDIL
jgi:hypothetical protein